MNEKNLGKTSIGMDANIAGFLCYLAGWITGLIFYLVEKENKFVRFHAMQSIIISVFCMILMFIPIINIFASILWFVLWLTMMITAFQGKKIKLPIAGDIAEKNA